MQSMWARVGVVAGAVVIAIVLFVALSGDDDGGEPATTATEVGQVADPETGGTGSEGQQGTEPKPDRPKPPTIVVRGGEPVGGVQTLEFEKGDRVRFRVRSDVDEEVHVHGYDLIKDVPAGGSVRFDFPAEIDGVFETELEVSHVPIAELRVNP